MTELPLPRGATSIPEMRGDNPGDTRALRTMHKRARAYSAAHDWCAEIRREYFIFGVGGVVAAFLFLVHLRSGGQELLWVVEGDLPSAYFVTDRAKTASAALRVYSELMEQWTRAVRTGKGLESAFPVDAPPDEKHAALLETRLATLRDDIIPEAVRRERTVAGLRTQRKRRRKR